MSFRSMPRCARSSPRRGRRASRRTPTRPAAAQADIERPAAAVVRHRLLEADDHGAQIRLPQPVRHRAAEYATLLEKRPASAARRPCRSRRAPPCALPLGMAQEPAQGVMRLVLAQPVKVDDGVDGLAAARKPLPQPLSSGTRGGTEGSGGRARVPGRERALPLGILPGGGGGPGFGGRDRRGFGLREPRLARRPRGSGAVSAWRRWGDVARDVRPQGALVAGQCAAAAGGHFWPPRRENHGHARALRTGPRGYRPRRRHRERGRRGPGRGSRSRCPARSSDA